MINIEKIILKTADFGVGLIREDGSMPPGSNGPYEDQETPLRNTGHWLMIFSAAFNLTGLDRYKVAVKSNAEYIYSETMRPGGYSFFHRTNPEKNFCNSLIGQAWTFESLKCASDFLGDDKYENLAIEVFMQHKFNKSIGLWNSLEINGKMLDIDRTFNHQLWFAACASLLNGGRKDEINKRLYVFLDNIFCNIKVLKNGLIYHPIVRNFSDNFFEAVKSFFKNFLREIIRKNNNFNSTVINEKMVHKSIGYHSFNMYAFAILREAGIEHPFFNSTIFKSAIDYMLSDEYLNGLNGNIYSYPYNPPGFEVPFVLRVFTDRVSSDAISIGDELLRKQLSITYNKNSGEMEFNTVDTFTLTARVYELTRILKYFS